MKVKELIEILKQYPDADVAVIENEDYGDKKTELSVYADMDNRVVIQFWD